MSTKPDCELCHGSGIEFIHGGHGNVLELPCSLCQPSMTSPYQEAADKLAEALREMLEYEGDEDNTDEPPICETHRKARAALAHYKNLKEGEQV